MKILLSFLLLPFGCFAQQDSAVKVYQGKKYVYHFNMQVSKGVVNYRNATVTVYNEDGSLYSPAIPTQYKFDKDMSIERGHVNRRNPNRVRTGIKGLRRN